MELRRYGHRWTLSHDNFDFVTDSKTKTTVHGRQAWKACIFQASALKRCIIGENWRAECHYQVYLYYILTCSLWTFYINCLCFDGSTSIFSSTSKTINHFSHCFPGLRSHRGPRGGDAGDLFRWKERVPKWKASTMPSLHRALHRPFSRSKLIPSLY